MKKWIEAWNEWNRQQNLRSLGPVRPKDLAKSIKWQRLRPVDAARRPEEFIAASLWITGYRYLPMTRRPGGHPLDRKRGRS